MHTYHHTFSMDQEFGHGFLGPLIFRIFRHCLGPEYPREAQSSSVHIMVGSIHCEAIILREVYFFKIHKESLASASDLRIQVFTWLSQATMDHLPFWSAQCKLIRHVNYTCKTPSALPSGLNTWPSCTVSTGCRACHSVLTQLFLFLILT